MLGASSTRGDVSKTAFQSPNQRCLPAPSTYSSFQADDADQSLALECQCAPCSRSPEEAAADGDLHSASPECQAWRESYFPNIGCPECVESDAAAAAASATCEAYLTQAECEAEGASGVDPIISPVSAPPNDPEASVAGASGAASATEGAATEDGAPVATGASGAVSCMFHAGGVGTVVVVTILAVVSVAI